MPSERKYVDTFGNKVYFCPECELPIIDKSAHDAWHDNQDIFARLDAESAR